MEKHSFNLVSFIFGLLFVGAAAAHFGAELWPNSLDSRWVWPTLLVIAGIAILGGAVTAIPARDTAGEPAELPEPDADSDDVVI